ncbi:MAG: outer membrane lipoprotein-sorting protein [Limnochordia bacterium]
MLKKIIPLVLIGLLLFGSMGAAQGLTIDEIMARVDENRHFTSAYSKMQMTIRSGRREMTKEMEAWTEGSNSLVEFTNRSDRGTKYLKLDDELWMFFPDAEDLVKISGHMLKQGFMGSDMSYEDMMVSEKMTDLYDFTLVGEEELDGRPTYVVKAQGKPGAEVSYALRQMWIDAETFLPLKEELYAVSGRLLKVMTVDEIREIEGRNYPVVVTMEDQLKRNSRTQIILSEIQFDVEIEEGTFSLDSLMR